MLDMSGLIFQISVPCTRINSSARTWSALFKIIRVCNGRKTFNYLSRAFVIKPKSARRADPVRRFQHGLRPSCSHGLHRTQLSLKRNETRMIDSLKNCRTDII